jgi:NitT/TauT family transport system permease protein
MDKITSFFKKYWITICIYIGMVLLYKFVADNKLLSSFLFPSIDSIVAAFGKHKATLFKNMLSSFQLMIPAIVISLAIALLVGTVMGMNKRMREVLHPVVYAVSVVPSILLAPFVLLLAPSFRTASLFLVIYGTIWSTLFATITGIQTIDKRYLDTAETLELRGFQKLVKVILPAASPSILSGFVSSLRGSFVVLVYAEMYGAKYGMGFYVKKYSEYGLYGETWSGFIFMVVVLIVVMQVFEKIKERLLRWTIN